LLNASAKSKAFEDQLQMNPQQALTASTLSQSSTVQEALKEYKQIERQLAIEQNRYLDNSPMITRLETKKATIKSFTRPTNTTSFRWATAVAQSKFTDRRRETKTDRRIYQGRCRTPGFG
jgi:hypothetical protein